MSEKLSAFPTFETHQQFDEDAGKYRDHVLPTGGMFLRDYFAAAILPLGASSGTDENPGSPEAVARYAYRVADAMLKERAK